MTEQDWQPLFDDFMIHLKADKGLATLTIRNYGSDLRTFHEYMIVHGISDLEVLDKSSIRGYLGWLNELGYVRRSIVRKLSTLRGFIRWLLHRELINVDILPKRGVINLDSRLPRFISQDQAERLVLSPDTTEPLGVRDRALLELIYAAGLRVSEAWGLNIGNLDYRSREIRVVGKGAKERVVLIGKIARDSVMIYARDVRPIFANQKSGNALFLNRYGGRLSRRSIQSKIRVYSNKVGLSPWVHTHTLRHSFATHMLEGGADLRVVQELMGHASPATTQIYTHVTPSQARKVYLSTHPRAKQDL